MAKILYVPDPHRCWEELAELGEQPEKTIAECSCGKRYMLRTSLGETSWHRTTTNPQKVRRPA